MIAGCGINDKKKAFVRLWDSSTGAQKSELSNAEGMGDIGWSHKGDYFACTDSSLRILDTRTLKEILRLRPERHNGSGKLAWSPVANVVAFNGYDTWIQIYDLDKSKLLARIPAEKTGRFGMFWSPDGKYLMMQDTNNMVAVCDAESGQYLGSKQIEEGSVLNWTPDSKNLVVTAMETDSVVFTPVDFSTTDSVLVGGVKGNPWKNQKVLEDLDDCFEALSKMLDPGTIERFKNTEEKDAFSFGWPGLGMALRNTWGLNENTPLVRDFRRNGVTNPKEMTSIILKSYWRKLHDKPVEFGKTQK